MPNPRDEFSKETIRILRERVCGFCSNPDCEHPTTGPHADPTKATRIGVAAHITAAAIGGPRYNPRLTPEERSDPDNGIWLCENCGRLIDADPMTYPEALIRSWRIEAERRARLGLQGKRPTSGTGGTSAQPSVPVMDRYTELRRVPITRVWRILFISLGAVLLPILCLVANLKGIYPLTAVPGLWWLFIAGVVAAMVIGRWMDELLIVLRGVCDNGKALQLRGERMAEQHQHEYVIFQKRGACQYPGCHGEITLTAPPVRHRHMGDTRLFGVCSIAGRQHSHAIDFNWMVQRETIDWRPLEKVTA